MNYVSIIEASMNYQCQEMHEQWSEQNVWGKKQCSVYSDSSWNYDLKITIISCLQLN